MARALLRHSRLFLVFCLLSVGCAHTPPWTTVGGKQLVDAGGFELDLPQDWMRFNPSEKDPAVTNEGLLLLITRDGLPLQAIRINRRPLDTEYPGTKKKLSKDMLPQELAELVLDKIKSNQNLTNQQVIENSPAKIGNLPGFRLVVSYQDKGGLKRKSIRYGLLARDGYYQLTYDAPARYYFPKDAPTFESLKESIRFLNPSDMPSMKPS